MEFIVLIMNIFLQYLFYYFQYLGAELSIFGGRVDYTGAELTKMGAELSLGAELSRNLENNTLKEMVSYDCF